MFPSLSFRFSLLGLWFIFRIAPTHLNPVSIRLPARSQSEERKSIRNHVRSFISRKRSLSLEREYTLNWVFLYLFYLPTLWTCYITDRPQMWLRSGAAPFLWFYERGNQTRVYFNEAKNLVFFLTILRSFFGRNFHQMYKPVFLSLDSRCSFLLILYQLNYLAVLRKIIY